MNTIFVIVITIFAIALTQAVPTGFGPGGLNGYNNPAAFNEMAGGIAGGVASSLSGLGSRYSGVGRPYGGLRNSYSGFGGPYGGLGSPYSSGGLGSLAGVGGRGYPYSGGYLGPQELGMNLGGAIPMNGYKG